MSNFFSRLDKIYMWFNDVMYKYLLFLYYLGQFPKMLYCAGLGVLCALALPPFNFFLLLPFVFASIIRLTDFCENKKQAYKVGLYFSFGFGLASLYWISFAVLEDKSTISLFPFALIGIPLIFSLFHALIFPFYLSIITYAGAVKKILVFTAIWVLFELGRYYILHFPWNFMGYTFSGVLPMLQVASIFGVLGLSFFTVIWAASFHLLLLTGDKAEFIKYFKFFLFNNILLFLFYVFGVVKILTSPSEDTSTLIRIIQGNVKAGSVENMKKDEHLEKYLSLTLSKSTDNINYIIWPEGSVHSAIYNTPEIKERLSNILGAEQYLITGSVRFEEIGYRQYNVFNSLIVLNKTGGAAFYDKTYLVPFGEFVPFRKFISFAAIAARFQDFSKGRGISLLKPSALSPAFLPLICYEITFSGRLTPKEKDLKAGWILNITNDAWYGYTSGPYQHLQAARLRSIEEGKPVVRASNNGISAVYDAYGRVKGKTSLFKEQILDIYLPSAPNDSTIFSKAGNLPLFLIILLFLLYQIGEFIYTKYDKIFNSIGYKIAVKKDKTISEKKK